jgi:stress response protein YsnF
VLLPAGTIDRVLDGGKVYVDLTKDQIKDSPEFDQSSYNEPDYRNRVGDYYGRYYTR